MNQRSDFTYRTDPGRTDPGRRTGRQTMERFRDYLLSRSTETWAFFAAGAVLGMIFG